MLIGIDGSRAFIDNRTGTENYSYQLIKNMSLIDTENRYLIYLRPGNSLIRFSGGRVGVKGIEAGMEEGSGAKGKRPRPDSPSPYQPPNPITLNQSRDWPPNFTFKVLDYPRFWTQIGLAKATFEDKLDVLFVPSHTLPLVRKPGLKTVITVHDLGAEYLPAMHQLKQVLYLNLMTHYQLKTASRIIAVSEAAKKDLVKRVGLAEKNIDVVYEGVDKTVFKKISIDMVNDIMKKYDLVHGKYFLFVGTIQPRKNLERLIRAFAILIKNRILEVRSEKWDIEVGSLDPLKLEKNQIIKNSKNLTSNSRASHLSLPSSNLKLVLVGGKGWKSDSIYKLPKELGIEKNVRFLGRVDDQDLAALYNGALALTYPSLFEGFGLPILEAFACGCPVITSNTSSMPEVAGNAAILVNPESIDEICKTMKQIYVNDTLRVSLTNKGILRSKNFDWKETARKTIDILERTAGK